MNEIITVTNTYDHQTAENLEKMKDRNIFHTPEWEEVLADSYDYHPFNFFLTVNKDVKVFIPFLEANSFIFG
jgi:hypothetical protein